MYCTGGNLLIIKNTKDFMRKISAFILSITVAILAGCATGNTSIATESTATIQQKLINGKTTKTEVRAAFGEPSDAGINDGKEYWGYQMAQASAKTFIPFAALVTGSSGISGKYLRITFDKKGVVTSYDISETRI
jgi:outer membrane protein assembly factor BamE (lipoprotein component of BamABCDE complex)